MKIIKFTNYVILGPIIIDNFKLKYSQWGIINLIQLNSRNRQSWREEKHKVLLKLVSIIDFTLMYRVTLFKMKFWDNFLFSMKILQEMHTRVHF